MPVLLLCECVCVCVLHCGLGFSAVDCGKLSYFFSISRVKSSAGSVGLRTHTKYFYEQMELN